jgi:hypothetical protein
MMRVAILFTAMSVALAAAAWRYDDPPEGDVIELSASDALATATARPGRSPSDPRTGRVVQATRGSATVRRPSCAEPDAWAVAALVLE